MGWNGAYNERRFCSQSGGYGRKCLPWDRKIEGNRDKEATVPRVDLVRNPRRQKLTNVQMAVREVRTLMRFATLGHKIYPLLLGCGGKDSRLLRGIPRQVGLSFDCVDPSFSPFDSPLRFFSLHRLPLISLPRSLFRWLFSSGRLLSFH